MFIGNRITLILTDRGEVNRLVVQGKNVDFSKANRSV